MVIDNFHVVEAVDLAYKTNAPLVIDANTVLPPATTGQRFKPVPGRCPHCVKRRCSVKLLKFADSNVGNVCEPLYADAREKLRRILTLKGLNHKFILYRLPVSVALDIAQSMRSAKDIQRHFRFSMRATCAAGDSITNRPAAMSALPAARARSSSATRFSSSGFARSCVRFLAFTAPAPTAPHPLQSSLNRP